MENLIREIQNILNKTLPAGCYIEVVPITSLGINSIKIFFAASDVDINRVSGQKPQAVSLSLEVKNLLLETQIYGGNGGGRITRKVNPDDPKERFYAMKGIQIPFRKPKNETVAVLKAIEKFATNWVELIRANKSILTNQIEANNYSNF